MTAADAQRGHFERPTREELLAICERALATPESAWLDRDSASACRQLGEAYALLKAGCMILGVERDDRLHTWWVTISYRGFAWFEGTGDAHDDMGSARDRLCDDERFYIPFAERVRDGEDWY